MYFHHCFIDRTLPQSTWLLSNRNKFESPFRMCCFYASQSKALTHLITLVQNLNMATINRQELTTIPIFFHHHLIVIRWVNLTQSSYSFMNSLRISVPNYFFVMFLLKSKIWRFSDVSPTKQNVFFWTGSGLAIFHNTAIYHHFPFT